MHDGDNDGAEEGRVEELYHTKTTSLLIIVSLMEVIYAFVVESCRMFLHHGLANFIVNVGDTTILNTTISAMFYACLLLPILGIIIDSYVGESLVVTFLFPFIVALPVLYFIISMPWWMMEARNKIGIFSVGQGLHGIIFLFEPVRFVTVSKAVLDTNQYLHTRFFFAVILISYNAGISLGALAIYLARSSRLAYSLLMINNIVCISAYVFFWVVKVRPERTIKTEGFFTIEKALLNAMLCLFNKFLKLVFRTGSSGGSDWKGFYCVVFNEQTTKNAKTLLKVASVMFPLCSLFFMKIALQIIYYTQFTMMDYQTEQYPIEGLKATMYIIICIPFEFLVCVRAKNCCKREIVRLLLSIGIGTFIVGLCLDWTALVQSQLVMAMLAGRASFIGEGQLTFVNGLPEPVLIRVDPTSILNGYSNGEWTSVYPFMPLSVLQVPLYLSPIRLSLKNEDWSMFDEYNLHFDASRATWFILHQQGLLKLPRSAFPSKQEVSMNPKLFDPARVAVMCLIPICKGYLKIDMGTYYKVEIPIESSNEIVVKDLAGEYRLMFAEVGKTAGQMVVEGTFGPLSSYLILIYNHFERPFSLNDVNGTLKNHPKIKIIETIPPRRLSVYYMYFTAFLHALGEAIAMASFWCLIYNYSTPPVRASLYCTAQFLSTPALMYFYLVSPIMMQRQKPLTIFTVGCVNSLCLIVFLFSAIRYSRINPEETATPMPYPSEEYTSQDAFSSRISQLPESGILAESKKTKVA